MKIAVPIKFVPDLVEELTIDPGGASLDTTWLRLIISEFDDHAVEQAILVKEKTGGEVMVMAADADGVDDFLFTAAAKGADRLVKFTGNLHEANNHALARLYTDVIKEWQPDLVFTGVQAHNDIDGSIGALLAANLGWPYIGYVAGMTTSADCVTVRKEFTGGLVGEYEVRLPAVIGIQAAEQPPRYVAYSKIRQVMGTAKIEEKPVDSLDLNGGTTISRMFLPEVTSRANMLEGSPDEVADRLVAIFKELGTL